MKLLAIADELGLHREIAQASYLASESPAVSDMAGYSLFSSFSNNNRRLWFLVSFGILNRDNCASCVETGVVQALGLSLLTPLVLGSWRRSLTCPRRLRGVFRWILVISLSRARDAGFAPKAIPNMWNIASGVHSIRNLPSLRADHSFAIMLETETYMGGNRVIFFCFTYIYIFRSKKQKQTNTERNSRLCQRKTNSMPDTDKISPPTQDSQARLLCNVPVHSLSIHPRTEVPDSVL